MMNNQFNTTNLTTQHGIQMAQHVATSPPQAPAAVLNTFLNAQQQQQQQLAAAVAAGALYGDPRQLQINSNTLDKNYYTTTATTLGALGTPQRFYTTAGPTASGAVGTPNATSAHHPNTILITNNFTQQQAAGQSLSPEHQRNIRIVTSTSNPLNTANSGNLATSASGFQHAQHVFNLNNNKQLQHLFPQHLLHQSSYQPATTTDLLQHHFANQHFPAAQQQQTPPQLPQFYVSPENPITANPKIITNIPSNSAATASGNSTNGPLVSNNSNPNQSTVVLDRINICINNLYTDTSSSSSASNSLASTPAQQPSPIIPAIQHKPIIENGPPALSINNDIYESNVLVIDEPDSTTTATTPHTPPTTPENTPPSMPNIGNNNNNNNSNNNNIISTTSTINSPSTSSNYQKIMDKPKNITVTKQSFASAAQNIEKAAQEDSNKFTQSLSRTTVSAAVTTDTDSAQTTRSNITTTTTNNTPLTPPTPPSPEVTNNNNNNNKEYLNDSKQTPTNAPPPAPLFANGDDVFIKRHDDRFYLGTVIDTARNQFLVRFDDKTEVWCDPEQMRKFGNSANTNASAEEKSVDQPMCVACKRSRSDTQVEICERCGRGYHRKCTTETAPGSEIWLCKRCAKPMKLEDTSKFSSTEGEETEAENCLQLHYNLESLTWDDKHRMNEEQIYCYCGKSGKFDNNMLQCWRCLNWYHTHCTQKFRGNILRGDCFFVFCCSVCNDGEEYLRRLQANWLDTVHLILYNLSTLKKHHKFHHLLKDINPYVLEKRKLLPIPKEWNSMPEKEFLDKIKSILMENSQMFVCGKEVKKDAYSFALRCVEPPEIKKIPIKSQDTINDDFVFNNLKLQILSGASENKDYKYLNTNCLNIDKTPTSKRKLNEDSSSHDVYEFDDTSEDEIPIKHILEKVKKAKLSPRTELKFADEPKTPSSSTSMKNTLLEKMDVEDDNANDALMSERESYTLTTPKIKKEHTPKKEVKNIESPHKSPLAAGPSKSKEETSLGEKVRTEKSSRKRKAFTLSKSYTAPHLIDTSSDENSSSSSRGTSLDLIIPPPKNFLGQNNPFRIISPKKNSADMNASTSSGKKSVSFGIFNTTALNFSTKLAALKSAGLFPKLSTSNLAKAAGQPRTVRTIKRRLSAKDITIGPNKEVRRRRTRRLSSNIEVISTTTINPIPTNFFPIQAKDLLAAAAASTTTAASLFTNTQTKTFTSSLNTTNSNNNLTTTASASTATTLNTESSNVDNVPASVSNSLPAHGRRLRQRPQKNSPNTSRRSSVSSNQSSTSSAAASQISTPNNTHPSSCQEDLKQTVNKYFGIVNRIESGEQFSIRAKRQLANGQMQYLIEWGGEAQHVPVATPAAVSTIQTTTQNLPTNTTVEQTSSSESMEVSTTT